MNPKHFLIIFLILICINTVSAVWWNTSYDYRMNITDLTVSDLAIFVNNTVGKDDWNILVNPSKCGGTMEWYYNNATSYQLTCDNTDLGDWEIESTGLGNNPTDVYSNDAVAVYHFGWEDTEYTNDSTSNDNDGICQSGEPELYSDYLVAHWKLDGDATDETGNYDGTPADVTYEVSPRTQAGVFNGSGYISMGDVLDLGLDDRTVAAWVKINSESGIYGKAYSKTYGPGQLYTESDYIRVLFDINQTDFFCTSTTKWTDEEWHFVAYTIDRDGLLSIYVDGGDAEQSKDISSVALIDSQTTYRTSIGAFDRDGTTIGVYTNGSIDAVYVWNTSLTNSEIEDVYNQTHLKYTDSGKYGGAFEFDGVDDLFSMGDVLDIGLNDRTYTVWIKGSEGVVFGKAPTKTSGQGNLRINPTGDTMRFLIDISGVDYIVDGTTDTNDGEWHFVAVTLDRDDLMSIYTDEGSAEDTINISSFSATDLNNTDDFIIGTLTNMDKFFNGTIDEVRIYNRSLSPIEIEELYNNSIPGRNMNLDVQEQGVLTMSGYTKDIDGNLKGSSVVIVIDQANPSVVYKNTTSNSTGYWSIDNIQAEKTYVVMGYDPNNSTLDGDAEPHILPGIQ